MTGNSRDREHSPPIFYCFQIFFTSPNILYPHLSTEPKSNNIPQICSHDILMIMSDRFKTILTIRLINCFDKYIMFYFYVFRPIYVSLKLLQAIWELLHYNWPRKKLKDLVRSTTLSVTSSIDVVLIKCINVTTI